MLFSFFQSKVAKKIAMTSQFDLTRFYDAIIRNSVFQLGNFRSHTEVVFNLVMDLTDHQIRDSWVFHREVKRFCSLIDFDLLVTNIWYNTKSRLQAKPRLFEKASKIPSKKFLNYYIKIITKLLLQNYYTSKSLQNYPLEN